MLQLLMATLYEPMNGIKFYIEIFIAQSFSSIDHLKTHNLPSQILSTKKLPWMICLNRNFHITRYFWLFGPKITSTPQKPSFPRRSAAEKIFDWDQLVNFYSSLDVLFEEKYLYSFWKFILEYKSDWILFCDNYGCFKKPSNQWLAKAGSLQVNKSISKIVHPISPL